MAIFAQNLTVEIKVLQRGFFPGKVFLQRRFGQFIPGRTVIVIKRDGVLTGVKQFVRVNIAERKAVSAAVKFIIGSDGIAQTTRFPHDGQGAIAHGQHL